MCSVYPICSVNLRTKIDLKGSFFFFHFLLFFFLLHGQEMIVPQVINISKVGLWQLFRKKKELLKTRFLIKY